MKKYAIIVHWSDEDAVWIAEAPDLEPCAAHGDTPEQALAELRVAMELWLGGRSRERTTRSRGPLSAAYRSCRVACGARAAIAA
jgi:predicted RNase H-like HicB family nuclease